MDELKGQIDEKKLARTEAIIMSMTPEERSDPKLLSVSRKQRIAKGAGMDIAEVNRFIKQFNESAKLMKKMPGMLKGRRHGGLGKLPFKI